MQHELPSGLCTNLLQLQEAHSLRALKVATQTEFLMHVRGMLGLPSGYPAVQTVSKVMLHCRWNVSFDLANKAQQHYVH